MRIFGRTAALAELVSSAPLAPYPPPLIESPWAPTDALAVATLTGLYDQLDAIPVTRAQAIALPAVARGRDLIVTTIARMPLWALNAAGRLDVQPRATSRPEIGRARSVTLTWTVDALLFYGFAIWEIVERYAEPPARPRIFRLVPPGQVETNEAGEVVTLRGRQVSRDDYIRFDGPHEGILQRANESIRSARRLMRNYYDAVETPVPDIELHQTGGEPLTDAERDSLIQTWVDKRRGVNGRVGFSNQSIEVKYNGEQPQDLLISARNAMQLDMARHLNLPAWAVDAEVGGSSLTYTNVPSRWRELIDGTLGAYMESITGRLSLDDVLAAGTWAAFSTDYLTDGSFGDRMSAYKAARDAEVFTADELRRREAGLPMEGPSQ